MKNLSTVLCLTASIAVHAREFVYDLSAVDNSYQFFTVTEKCVTSWCTILWSNIYICKTPM
jgi:hypothetical protein